MNSLIISIQIMFEGKKEENLTMLSGIFACLKPTTDEVSWWLITYIHFRVQAFKLLVSSLSSFQLPTTWHLQSFFITWSIPDGRWVAEINMKIEGGFEWCQQWRKNHHRLLSSVLLKPFLCFRCWHANMEKALSSDKLLPESNYNIE